MKTRTLGLVAALVVSITSSARAADPVVELGTTMMSVTVGVGDDNEVTMIGIPSGGFGLLNPGVYGSVFVGSFVSVEPQVGLIWVSFDGDSSHVVNFSGQANYFVRGSGRSSPYVFAAAGILGASDSDENPKTVGAGAGYRFAVGESLAFRLDGRYVHFTEGGGNALVFGLSIGGVFRR